MTSLFYFHDFDQPEKAGNVSLRLYQDDDGNGFSRAINIFFESDGPPEAKQYTLNPDELGHSLNVLQLNDGNRLDTYGLIEGTLTLTKVGRSNKTTNAIEYHEVTGTLTGTYREIGGESRTLELNASFCLSQQL